MYDNASDLYNILLANYKYQYTNISNEKKRANVLAAILVIYFLMIMNMTIILIKNRMI